jgi:membrane protease YdiL (CAAX protease family)
MNGRTKGIVAYILIAFVMAWILWEVPIRLGLSLQSPLTQLVILPGAFSPAVAALVVRKWITGEGFADAIVVLSVAFGVDQPDFSLQRAFQTLVPGGGQMPSFVFGLLVLQAMVTSLIATPLLWGEEFGWRGYLQIRLLSHRPLLAAVATGIIWGIWHIPLNLRGYNFPERPILGLFAFPVSAVLLSIIFGWLRLKTESVWSASLAHAATNAIGGSLTMLGRSR